MEMDYKNNSGKSNLIKIAIILALSVGLLVAVYFLGMNKGKSKNEMTEAIEAATDVKETTTASRELIESTVKAASDLVTTKYHYRDVMTFTKDKTGSVFGKEFTLGSEQRLFVYAGEINVGYDVSQITVNVDDSIKVIKVILPEPKVIAHTTYDDEFQEYEIETSVWVESNTQEVMEARQKLKEEQQTELMANADFISSVRKNAEVSLKELLNAATGNAGYDIVFL